jgi:hypothetical protein
LYYTIDGRAEIENFLSPDERWYAHHHGEDFE